ncbi:MAG: phosphate ABC transporter, permease protein PstA [Bdellovibrionales bacterium RBG_16_40_8]|nr:MAG: phosphate ABC transporter, permease protein PstA [Bdellovibrionales bacterium RBG_16_40_8]
MSRRKLREKIFHFFAFSFSWLSVLVLLLLVWSILRDGLHVLKPHFFTSFPSRFAAKAGIYAPLIGSLWVMTLTAIISIPIGVSTALYFEEYAPKNRFADLLQINIATLAGMPAIIYGLMSLAVFVRYLGFERSVLSASLCMSLLVLPTIIIAAQGSIRAVPINLREAAFALGARRYQVVFGQVLPAAVPGIMTGIILALSRAMGEAAPLILLGALSYVAFVPKSIMDSYTVLPVQIFNWVGRPQEAFHDLAAGAIIVLIVFLFALNFGAVIIRSRFQRYK